MLTFSQTLLPDLYGVFKYYIQEEVKPSTVLLFIS